VVVAEGEMTLEPVVGTVPMPGLIEAVVAFVEDQDKVADCPSEMELGEALRVAVGGCRSASQTKLRFESYTCKVRPVAPPGYVGAAMAERLTFCASEIQKAPNPGAVLPEESGMSTPPRSTPP
jgi:hypothetical protein